MRETIHPDYHKVTAVCVCGNTIDIGSTLPEIRMDVCSACHPYYTGTQKIMDTEGRVEKFKKRFEGVTPVKKEKKVVPPTPPMEKKEKKAKPAAAAAATETKPGKHEVKNHVTLANGTKVELECEIKIEGALTLTGKPESKLVENDKKVELKTWFELTDGTEIEVEAELKFPEGAEAGEATVEKEGGETEVKRVFKFGDLAVEAETEIKISGGKALAGTPERKIESTDKKLQLKLYFNLEDGTKVEIESEVEFSK